MIDEGPQTTRLELARRHVAEGQIRISAHCERMRKLRAAGEDTRDADQLLHSLLQTLEIMRASLALEETIRGSERALVFAALDETRTACLT